MTDLDDHPFSAANIAREGGAPDASEARWLKWAAEVERLLGHDLDGNENEDGYSIDFAYEAFSAGHIPASYAGDVAKKKRRIASVADMRARFAAGEFD